MDTKRRIDETTFLRVQVDCSVPLVFGFPWTVAFPHRTLRSVAMEAEDVSFLHISFLDKREIVADPDFLLAGNFSLSDAPNEMLDDIVELLKAKMYRVGFKRYRVNDDIYTFLEVRVYRLRSSSSCQMSLVEHAGEDELWVITLAVHGITSPICLIVFLGTPHDWQGMQHTCTVVVAECWQSEHWARHMVMDAQLHSLD